ncbi:putative ribonuclease H protein [Sesbania bispinosa]|nr:putative ribonuclease H protein [Sesbania bispinosa]
MRGIDRAGPLFTAAVWHIWLSRNCLTFENVRKSDGEIVWFSVHLADVFRRAFQSTCPAGADSRALRLVAWEPPNHEQVALNVDGNVTETHVGFGGLIRLHDGSWVRGFYGRLHDVDILEAELIAIFEASTSIFSPTQPLSPFSPSNSTPVKTLSSTTSTTTTSESTSTTLSRTSQPLQGTTIPAAASSHSVCAVVRTFKLGSNSTRCVVVIESSSAFIPRSGDRVLFNLHPSQVVCPCLHVSLVEAQEQEDTTHKKKPQLQEDDTPIVEDVKDGDKDETDNDEDEDDDDDDNEDGDQGSTNLGFKADLKGEEESKSNVAAWTETCHRHTGDLKVEEDSISTGI